MNPHQKNKIDISSLNPEEQRLFRMYGKLPNQKDVLQNKLKERKYFDSGDYALSKAGKASDVGVTQIGREHPNPETIPHPSSSPHNANGTEHRGSISAGISGIQGPNIPTISPPANGAGNSHSPVKESSYLARAATNAEESQDQPRDHGKDDLGAGSISPPPKTEGVPIPGQ